MSLHHFKYVGKRQVAATAANGVGKPRTVKAMTLPARMAPPDFSSDSPATGTLQPHNTAVRENLVDDDSGKNQQALLEANMATEVGLIALDCLGLFCIHFKVRVWHRHCTIVYYATRAYSITLRTSGAPIARVCKEVRPSCIRYFMQFCVESSI